MAGVRLSNFPSSGGKAIDISVTLGGRQEVVRTLRSVTRAVAAELAKALNETIVNVHRRARLAAPVGVSGRLRASITPILVAGDGGKKNGLMLGSVGTNAKQAPFVEFGTSQLGAKTNRQQLPAGYRHGVRHKFPGRLVGGVSGVGFGARNVKRLVPVPSITLWARRKGVDAFGVAMRIAGRGFGGKGFGTHRMPGVRAQPMLGPALESEEQPFLTRIQKAFDAGARQGGAR